MRGQTCFERAKQNWATKVNIGIHLDAASEHFKPAIQNNETELHLSEYK